MEYMFLIYADEKQAAGRTAEQNTEVIARHWAIMDEATSRGVFRGASPLQPIASALTVTRDSDKLRMTDGPFAETKEVLGGYYIIDCQDLQDAKYWATRLSEIGCGSAVEGTGSRANTSSVGRRP